MTCAEMLERLAVLVSVAALCSVLVFAVTSTTKAVQNIQHELCAANPKCPKD